MTILISFCTSRNISVEENKEKKPLERVQLKKISFKLELGISIEFLPTVSFPSNRRFLYLRRKKLSNFGEGIES